MSRFDDSMDWDHPSLAAFTAPKAAPPAARPQAAAAAARPSLSSFMSGGSAAAARAPASAAPSSSIGFMSRAPAAPGGGGSLPSRQPDWLQRAYGAPAASPLATHHAASPQQQQPSAMFSPPVRASPHFAPKIPASRPVPPPGAAAAAAAAAASAAPSVVATPSGLRFTNGSSGGGGAQGAGMLRGHSSGPSSSSADLSQYAYRPPSGGARSSNWGAARDVPRGPGGGGGGSSGGFPPHFNPNAAPAGVPDRPSMPPQRSLPPSLRGGGAGAVVPPSSSAARTTFVALESDKPKGGKRKAAAEKPLPSYLQQYAHLARRQLPADLSDSERRQLGAYRRQQKKLAEQLKEGVNASRKEAEVIELDVYNKAQAVERGGWNSYRIKVTFQIVSADRIALETMPRNALAVVNLVKAIQGAVFDTQLKNTPLNKRTAAAEHEGGRRGLWTVPLAAYEPLLARLVALRSQSTPEIDIVIAHIDPKHLAAMRGEGPAGKGADTRSFESMQGIPPNLARALYPFQRVGVEYAVNHGGRALIADEMGLGKSIQAIAVAAYYQNEWPLLIVCPSSVRLTWRNELLKWLGVGSLRAEDVTTLSSDSDIEEGEEEELFPLPSPSPSPETDGEREWKPGSFVSSEDYVENDEDLERILHATSKEGGAAPAPAPGKLTAAQRRAKVAAALEAEEEEKGGDDGDDDDGEAELDFAPVTAASARAALQAKPAPARKRLRAHADSDEESDEDEEMILSSSSSSSASSDDVSEEEESDGEWQPDANAGTKRKRSRGGVKEDAAAAAGDGEDAAADEDDDDDDDAPIRKKPRAAKRRRIIDDDEEEEDEDAGGDDGQGEAVKMETADDEEATAGGAVEHKSAPAVEADADDDDVIDLCAEEDSKRQVKAEPASQATTPPKRTAAAVAAASPARETAARASLPFLSPKEEFKARMKAAASNPGFGSGSSSNSSSGGGGSGSKRGWKPGPQQPSSARARRALSPPASAAAAAAAAAGEEEVDEELRESLALIAEMEAREALAKAEQEQQAGSAVKVKREELLKEEESAHAANTAVVKSEPSSITAPAEPAPYVSAASLISAPSFYDADGFGGKKEYPAHAMGDAKPFDDFAPVVKPAPAASAAAVKPETPLIAKAAFMQGAASSSASAHAAPSSAGKAPPSSRSSPAAASSSAAAAAAAAAAGLDSRPVFRPLLRHEINVILNGKMPLMGSRAVFSSSSGRGSRGRGADRFNNSSSSSSTRVVIMSYDLIAKYALALQTQRFQIIVADESHYIKNASAQRSQALLPLLEQSRRVLCLSGTPAMSRPFELYPQIQALCPGAFGTAAEFGARYCAPTKGFRGKVEFKGAQNLAELHVLLKQYCLIRRLKSEVLRDLKPKTRTVIQTSCTDRALMDNLKRFTDLKHKLQAQINAAPADASGAAAAAPPSGGGGGGMATGSDDKRAFTALFADTGLAKLPFILSFVGDMMEQGHKFLLFAHHQAVLNGIEQLLVKQKVDYFRIDGSTKPADRQKGVERFQADPSCRVALLSITAGGTGLTLTAASTVVFAELQWTPALLCQAEDRVHRIGQFNPVNIYYILASHTLDDYLWPLLSAKLEVLGSALDGREERMHVERQLKSASELVLRDHEDEYKQGARPLSAQKQQQQLLLTGGGGVGAASSRSPAPADSSRPWAPASRNAGVASSPAPHFPDPFLPRGGAFIGGGGTAARLSSGAPPPSRSFMSGASPRPLLPSPPPPPPAGPVASPLAVPIARSAPPAIAPAPLSSSAIRAAHAEAGRQSARRDAERTLNNAQRLGDALEEAEREARHRFDVPSTQQQQSGGAAGGRGRHAVDVDLVDDDDDDDEDVPIGRAAAASAPSHPPPAHAVIALAADGYDDEDYASSEGDEHIEEIEDDDAPSSASMRAALEKERRQR